MGLIPVEELPQHVQPGKKLCGLDLGTRTIGIAVSDLGFSFANPRPVLQRRKFTQDSAALATLFHQEGICAVVLGLPINMDGSEGPRAQSTRAFLRNMETRTDLPFVLWDERLSTVAAERALLAQDMSRRVRSQRIDSAAAAFILQGVLDRLHTLSASLSPE